MHTNNYCIATILLAHDHLVVCGSATYFVGQHVSQIQRDFQCLIITNTPPSEL